MPEHEPQPAYGPSESVDANRAVSPGLPAAPVNDPALVEPGQLYIGYLSAGAGRLSIAGSSFTVSAPAALLLTDGEAAETSWAPLFTVMGVAFRPSFIDSSFSGYPAVPSGLAERFEADAFGPFFREPRPAAGILQLSLPEAPVLARYFHDLSGIFTDLRAPYAPCRFRSVLLSLVHYLGYRTAEPSMFRGTCTVPDAADRDPLVRDVLLFLHAAFTRTVTLEELCSRFATNRTTLTKAFRGGTGMTVGEYLTALRMRHAQSLLRETSLPISEIALGAGYRDVTHFGRVFRNRTGRTPGEYRQCFRSPAT